MFPPPKKNCARISRRYGLLLKLYLQRCGAHKGTLAKQLYVNEALTSIAQQVHHVRPKKAQKYNEFVQRELKKVKQKVTSESSGGGAFRTGSLYFF